MKAILIDAVNKEVKEVEIDETKRSLDQYYSLIGCDMIEAAYLKGCSDVIYVDEEGMLGLTAETPFFFMEGTYQPIAGSGIVVGTDYDTGNTIAPVTTLEEVKRKVRFLDVYQVQAMVNR